MAKLDWHIREFTPHDAAAFASLNRAWIEEMFGMEEKDRRQLEYPQKTILEPGGYIAVADARGWVVGTGAILPAAYAPEDGNSWMEIVKMATEPSAQGQGIGAAVLDRLIEEGRQRGANRIWLETNSQLEAATALYEKKGFVALSAEEAWETPYLRCNLQMTMAL
ncbi:GNAT family N-acetyltransferase [Erythrobacter sp. THAF29]|uniref:GNAT family N-acetyltransferase n=1 Tax=Erythrobacter sp. THAF29 TaxID=2587851 RepID=UPI0012691AF3|nr:GNAT family N-acetyltransferase [Erythrobacter sp. THAF29]QFT77890.1 ribosomal-protein-alanine N-acetyltransferase [Erythrobacter sp. THAF29]